MKKKRISAKNPKSKEGLKPSTATSEMVNKGEMKRLTIDVPVSLHMQLKVVSAKKGQTMGDIVRDCIRGYLDREESQET